MDSIKKFHSLYSSLKIPSPACSTAHLHTKIFAVFVAEFLQRFLAEFFIAAGWNCTTNKNILCMKIEYSMSSVSD